MYGRSSLILSDATPQQRAKAMDLERILELCRRMDETRARILHNIPPDQPPPVQQEPAAPPEVKKEVVRRPSKVAAPAPPPPPRPSE